MLNNLKREYIFKEIVFFRLFSFLSFQEPIELFIFDRLYIS